jgi:hypothetical protein
MEQRKPVQVEVTTQNTGALTMGIISIVVGVLALLFGWIPFLGLLAIPVALIGLLLAGIGIVLALVKKTKGILLPLLGAGISSIALIISMLSTVGSSMAISESMKKARQISEENATIPTKEMEEKSAYINTYLDLYDIQVKYHDSELHGRVPGILFKLKNRGDRQLDKVEVTVYFKDSNGKVISEEDYTPILVSEFSFNDDKPLKPGYIWQMESGKYYMAKSVPEEWVEGSVEMKITDIRFSKSQ